MRRSGETRGEGHGGRGTRGSWAALLALPATWTLTTLLGALLLALTATPAAAEPPPLLWKAASNCEAYASFNNCEKKYPDGQAGTVQIPLGIVTDPANGHLYVADLGNDRISEFDAWGAFVRAFGWDVAPDGAPGDTAEDGFEVCTASCRPGRGVAPGGALAHPGALALDSEGGLYVTESSCCHGNNRISKFDLSGPEPAFEWALGGDVVQSGPDNTGADEQQAVTVKASGGSFALRPTTAAFSGKVTEGSATVSEVLVPYGALHVGDRTSIDGLTIEAIEGDTLTLSGKASFSAASWPSTATETTAPIAPDASAAEVQAALEALPGVGAGAIAVGGGPLGATESEYALSFSGGIYAGNDVEAVEALGEELSGTATVTTTAPGGGPEVCRAAEGDVCKAGRSGTAAGEFEWFGGMGSVLAVGAGDRLYAGDKDRIEQFDSEGGYLGQIDFSGGGEAGEAPGPGRVAALAADEEGDLYFTAKAETQNYGKPWIEKLDPASGEVLCGSEAGAVERPGALAAAEGTLYAFDTRLGGTPPIPAEVVELEAECSGGELARTGGFEARSEDGVVDVSKGIATGSACLNAGADLYLGNAYTNDSYLLAYGDPPDKLDGEGELLCPPPARAPRIVSQSIVGADAQSTTVQAKVSPRFWSDATYQVEWGTGRCSEGGCERRAPLTPAQLGGGTTDQALSTARVVLSDLAPGTTYHFRFTATSSGGGPVYGVDPDGSGPEEASFAGGEEGEFTTFAPEAPPRGGCANQDFRGGLAATLPECRAYEQISPVEKSGFDLEPAPVIARPDGEAVAFTSQGAFADPRAGAMSGAYTARRGGGEWASENVSPPYDTLAGLITGKVLGLAGDLGSQLVLTDAKLAAQGSEGDVGAVNVYLHDSATDSYRFIATSHALVTGSGSLDAQQCAIICWARFAGAAADGGSFVFGTPANALGTTPDGPPGTGGSPANMKLYSFDAASGELSYVGVLPDGSTRASSPPNSALSDAVSHRSVSADGSRVYWASGLNPARIYLRRNPGAPESEREHGSAHGTGNLFGASVCTGTTITGLPRVSGAECDPSPFATGQQVAGSGIPAGTTVVGVEETGEGVFKFTLSARATKTQVGSAELSGSASTTVAGAEAQVGAFEEGQSVSGPAIPAGTTIAAVEETGEGVFALELSAAPDRSEEAGTLAATSPCTKPELACTVAVSEREDGSVADGRFQQASADGRYAFLTSEGGLTEDASPSGADLYRYDDEAPEGERLTDLTPDAEGAGVGAVLGTGEDGAYAYFTATGELAAGAVAGGLNLYAWHEGETRLVGTLAPGGGVDGARVSPDGRYLGFLTAQEIAGPQPQKGWPRSQAYLYGWGADSLSCASCPPGGYTRADVSLHGTSQSDQAGIGTRPLSDYEQGATHNVTDAGQFFFQSADRLLLRDTNEKQDVYEYSAADGRAHLISTGQDAAPSYFGDATPDGEDAFFLTREQLVGQDADPFYDLYDARAGGGIAAQRGTAAGAACEGGGCQGPATAAPSVPGAGTSSFSGPGDPPALRPCRTSARRAARLARRAARLRRAARRSRGRARARRARRARRLAHRTRRLRRNARRCRRANRRRAAAYRRAAR